MNAPPENRTVKMGYFDAAQYPDKITSIGTVGIIGKLSR
jgi:hypothetical protein